MRFSYYAPFMEGLYTGTMECISMLNAIPLLLVTFVVDFASAILASGWLWGFSAVRIP